MPIEPTIIDRTEQPYVGITRTVTMASMSSIADELPGGRFVNAMYTGHYDDLVDVTGELLAWAVDRSLVWDSWPTEAGEAWGCRLEQYPTNPADQPDMAKQLTELTFRLAD